MRPYRIRDGFGVVHIESLLAGYPLCNRERRLFDADIIGREALVTCASCIGAALNTTRNAT